MVSKVLDNGDIEYVSRSSIDNPPTGKDFQMDKESPDLLDGERVFQMDLTLILRPIAGKAVKIPLATGQVRGLIVEAIINDAITNRQNRTIIQAVLDNPSQREGVQLSINEKKELF